MWFNYHTHSNYCDGKASLQEILMHAESMNLVSLGFSSHAPLPFECKWSMKKEKLDEYLLGIRSLKKSKNHLQVYAGLEVDYIPDVIGPNDYSGVLDYTIGSIHFVDNYGRTRWEIDGVHHLFLEGLEKIFNNNIQNAISRYFELTREMIANSCPTIIGHLDKIKMQNIDQKLFKETDSWYQHEVKKMIDAIAKSDSIVEVNTRGIYQKKSSTTYPSPWILEILSKRKIPVTISSDAHHPDDLVNHFEDTAHLLKEIGFRKISALIDGRWASFEFNEYGIKVK